MIAKTSALCGLFMILAKHLASGHTDHYSSADDQTSAILRSIFHILGVDDTAKQYDGSCEIPSPDPNKTPPNFPFDYGSLMWSPGCVPRDERYLLTTRVDRKVSFYDILSLNEIYCKEVCPNHNQCMNGGYVNPSNCSICICPTGFSGKNCELKESTCGEDLTATEDWQTSTIGFKENQKGPRINFFKYKFCDTWVKAPSNQGLSIEIEVLSLANNTIVEVLIDGDVRKSGVMINKNNRHIMLSSVKSMVPMRIYAEPYPLYSMRFFYGYMSRLEANIAFRYRYVRSENSTTTSEGTISTTSSAPIVPTTKSRCGKH